MRSNNNHFSSDNRALEIGPLSVSLAKYAGASTSTALPAIEKAVSGITKMTKSLAAIKGMPTPTVLKTPGQLGQYKTQNFAKTAGVTMLRDHFINGVIYSLEKTAMINPDNVEVVANLVKTANPAAIEAAAQATPEQLQQLQDSGLTSKDLEAAAKVVQVMAEMKATADIQGYMPQDQQQPVDGFGAQMTGQPGQYPPTQAQPAMGGYQPMPEQAYPMTQMQ